MKYYKLDGHRPVECSFMEWAQFFALDDVRIVGQTELATALLDGKIIKATVSTVFIGLDASELSGCPLLYETMVFGGAIAWRAGRYATWEEAEANHVQTVNELKEAAIIAGKI